MHVNSRHTVASDSVSKIDPLGQKWCNFIVTAKMVPFQGLHEIGVISEFAGKWCNFWTLTVEVHAEVKTAISGL